MIDVSPFFASQAVSYKKMLVLFAAFEFGEALKISKQYNILPTVADMDQVIDNLIKQRESEDVTNFSHQFDLRLNSLRRFRNGGCDPETILEKIILPEGYNGKILLVMFKGGILDGRVCLRSGDMWHREILRNTEIEINHLGFFESVVYELGGAHVRFEKNKDIVIFGTSDDFGSCDKAYAAELIQQIFNDRHIMIAG